MFPEPKVGMLPFWPQHTEFWDIGGTIFSSASPSTEDKRQTVNRYLRVMSKSEIQRRDIQWAEVRTYFLHRNSQLIHQGIRGLASLIVVVAHGYEAFGWPKHSFDRPYIFQIPFTRLILDGGYLAVCIFFLLSGYLCAIKPLRLLRAGNPDEARRAIASGALRRLVRLGIPATLATTFSWFLTQIGAFTVSTSQPGDVWLNFHSAWPSSTWSVALRGLRFAIVGSFAISLMRIASYVDVRR